LKDFEARNLDADVLNLRFKHYQEILITNVNNTLQERRRIIAKTINGQTLSDMIIKDNDKNES